ncbi:Uncharacterised protein [Pseudomonas luteola]|uniref:Uncharacterized protein n=1 Tax=Pseudomonas luteola TaxID=47886 RepID=A0A2X2CIK0_PSELU|nr:hypothetical protein [Pseudomonas luteola]SPY99995.1 Uncharacterised protein [Pseudomonas luteola]
MKIKGNKQTILEYAEYMAANDNNRRWCHNSYIYLQFQLQIITCVEWRGTFSEFPIAFTTKESLLLWAGDNRQTVKGIPNTSENDVLLTIGSEHGPVELRGQPFVWVRAKYSNYREALFNWIDTQRTQNWQRLHAEACIYCKDIADALAKDVIRKNVTQSKRKDLIKEFIELSEEFDLASQSKKTAEDKKQLLWILDRSLDADHVVNRKSLKHHPNAWVLLAPVLSGTNRTYGRSIERYLEPISASSSRVTLDPIIALKLFAAKIPESREEMEAEYKALIGRFIVPSLTLNYEFAQGEKILKAFKEGKKKGIS